MAHNRVREEEAQLLELKARVEDLSVIRNRLVEIGAHYVETLHQVDTYFKVPRGRLKIREVEGSGAELIYYERENKPKPKRSSVFIIRLDGGGTLKGIIKRILKELVVVEKVREIYRHRGTEIHLDTVKGLGTFIEFERRIRDAERDREELDKLMVKLGIREENLERLSYSDLLIGKR